VPTTPTTLAQARAEAVLAHLTGDAIDGYLTLAELRGEFVHRQHWAPAELNRAIDTLAATGRVELDGIDGQITIALAQPALRATA
jgi:hypothetical protein